MSFWTYLLYLIIALGFLFMSIIVGDRAPWYFAWILGTFMAILVAVGSAVFFEAQEQREQQEKDPAH